MAHTSHVRPADFNTLRLIWRPKVRTLRWVVGTLSKSDDSYQFVYDGEDLVVAKAAGFSGYPGMDDLTATYNGQAINSFETRMPSRERPDLDQILAAWGANASMTNFQILGLTFASLPTDLFELIPVIPPERGVYFYSNLAGIQEFAGSEVFRLLPPGTALELESDSTNEFDCHAVSVSYSGCRVAYIKRVHCESVCLAMKNGIDVAAELVRARINGIINEVVVKITYT